MYTTTHIHITHIHTHTRDRLSINYSTYVDVCVRNVIRDSTIRDSILRFVTLVSRIHKKKKIRKKEKQAIHVIARLVTYMQATLNDSSNDPLFLCSIFFSWINTWVLWCSFFRWSFFSSREAFRLLFFDRTHVEVKSAV